MTKVSKSVLGANAVGAAQIDAAEATAIKDKLGIGAGGASKIAWLTQSKTDTDLFVAMTEITGFRKEIYLPSSGILWLSASLDLKHRGIVIGGTDQYPIGFAIRTPYRLAASQAGLAAAPENYVPNAYAAGNIASLDDHYGQAIYANVPLVIAAATWIRISISATAHSSVAPTTDGLIELNGNGSTDYNYMSCIFEPGMTLL